MAQASLLVIVASCQLIAIAKIEYQAIVFIGIEARIEIGDPYNTIAAFDEVENFIPPITNIGEREFYGHAATLPHSS